MGPALAILTALGLGAAGAVGVQSIKRNKEELEGGKQSIEDAVKGGNPSFLRSKEGLAIGQRVYGKEMAPGIMDFYSNLAEQNQTLIQQKIAENSANIAREGREQTAFQQMQSALFGPGIPEPGNPPLASSAYENPLPTIAETTIPSPKPMQRPKYTQLTPEERKVALLPATANVVSRETKIPGGSQGLEDISLRDKGKPYGLLSQADRATVYKTWKDEAARAEADKAAQRRKAVVDQEKIIVGPMVDQAVSSRAYNPAVIGNRGETRAAFNIRLSEDYPNADVNKMYSNAKFQTDPILNRAIVWADSADERLAALPAKIAELKPGQFPTLNAFRNWLAYQLGSEEIADAISGTNSVLFETLRAIGGSGQFTDFRLKLEQAQMSPNMTQAQFQKGVANLQAAIAALRKARGRLPFEDIRIDPTKNITDKPSKGFKTPKIRKELEPPPIIDLPPLSNFETP